MPGLTTNHDELTETASEHPNDPDGHEGKANKIFYVKVYKSIRDSGFLAEVSGNGLKVLVAIALYINDAGEGWPSYGRLQRDTHLSEGTLKRCLRELEALGAIARCQERNGSGKWAHNVYSLTPDQSHFRFGKEPNQVKDAPSSSANNCPTVRPSVSPPPSVELPAVHRAAAQRASVKRPTKKSQQEEEPKYKEEPENKEMAERDESARPAPRSDLERLWASCQVFLQAALTRAAYGTWLAGSRMEALGDDDLVLITDKDAKRDWIEHRLAGLILQTVSDQVGRSVTTLRVVVEKPEPSKARPGDSLRANGASERIEALDAKREAK